MEKCCYRNWHALFALATLIGFNPAIAQVQSMTFVMEKFPPFILDQHGRGAGPFPEVVQAVCQELRSSALSRSCRGGVLMRWRNRAQPMVSLY